MQIIYWYAGGSAIHLIHEKTFGYSILYDNNIGKNLMRAKEGFFERKVQTGSTEYIPYIGKVFI